MTWTTGLTQGAHPSLGTACISSLLEDATEAFLSKATDILLSCSADSWDNNWDKTQNNQATVKLGLMREKKRKRYKN